MWQNAGLHDNLRLPARNEFIPTDFQLATREEDVRNPVFSPQNIKDLNKQAAKVYKLPLAPTTNH